MRQCSRGIIFFIFDRLLKHIVTQSDGFFIFGGLIGFALSKNSGIALSIPIPTIVSVPATIALILFIAWRMRRRVIHRRDFIFFALIFFGGISNLIDRIFYGYVLDYITVRAFSHEFSFNIADAMIVFGTFALLFSVRGEERNINEINKQTYNAIASAFSKSREKPIWGEVEQFAKYVKDGLSLDKAGAHILDIGCGNGRLVKLFNGMNVHYVGVDASDELLTLARERVVDTKLSIKFKRADMRDLPFESETFDFVFMIASVHHLSESDQMIALKEAHRVLKPGGMLFVTVFNMLRFSFSDKTVWRYRAYSLVRTLWNGFPLYYYAFTRGRLKRLCVEAGFEVREEFYASHGARSHWWNARNLVVIGKK